MKVKTAVIPVAGKGTRFLPVTKEIPKEMICILDLPMIHYVVEEAVRSGIEEIVFITAPGKKSVENYFKSNAELTHFLERKGDHSLLQKIKKLTSMASIRCLEQREPLGLGHAILRAQPLLKDETFAVLLPDDLIVGKPTSLLQLLKISKKYDDATVVGVTEISPHETDQYGIVDGIFIDEERRTLLLKGMLEKPSPQLAPTRLATPGRYIFTPDIFDALQGISPGLNGEYQLTDGINLLLKSTKVYAHHFTGERYDTGHMKGHLRAIVHFALEDPRTKDAMKSIVAEVSSKYHLK